MITKPLFFSKNKEREKNNISIDCLPKEILYAAGLWRQFLVGKHAAQLRGRLPQHWRSGYLILLRKLVVFKKISWIFYIKVADSNEDIFLFLCKNVIFFVCSRILKMF